MAFDNWDEIRTAFEVARLGTVSGAAEVLGVHHATVIRHIDALENRLGAKLFQRHARGYTPTETGRDLFQVAQTTSDQFSQLAGRIKGQGDTVSGELVVTSVAGVAELITPALVSFQEANPAVRVRLEVDMRVYRLEYGEAHVAIRAGASPNEPDNVVQFLTRLRMGIFASRGYVERHGLPKGPEDFAGHRFVGATGFLARAPIHAWLAEKVGPQGFVFTSSEGVTIEAAMRAGAGIGVTIRCHGLTDPDLVEVSAAGQDLDTPLWMVTHVDLHRTAKVQAFLTHLKAAAKTWAGA
jgi:DNA-binding transcriptional LysR family regulator